MEANPLIIGLESCPFFSGLDPSSLAELAAIARQRTFIRGTRIFSQGDVAPGIYIVSEGLVRVFKTGATGKEHVLHLVGPGGTFAEVAVIAQFPCPAHAEATEETQCIFLPAAEFVAILRRDHALCLQLLSGMAYWVRSFLDLMDGIVLKDAISRVASYLLEESGKKRENRVVLPSLKKYVASHLNLTGETLSRTLKQLKDAGLIEERAENELQVNDRGRLEQVAQGLFPFY